MFLCGWGGLGRSKVKNPFWQKSHTSAQSPQNPPFLEWLSKKERWSFSSVLSAVLPWFKDLQWYSKLVPSCMKKQWQFLYANYNDRRFISHLFFFFCNSMLMQWSTARLQIVKNSGWYKRLCKYLTNQKCSVPQAPPPKFLYSWVPLLAEQGVLGG